MLEDRKTPACLPTGVVYALVILAVASLVPFAFFAKARYATSSSPRIHAIGDMDWQPKYKAQRANPIFSDGRANRIPDQGTVAVGELNEDDHFYRGKQSDAWALTFPPSLKLDEELMARGKERFGIYCAPCHGISGEGDGMIARRAESLQQGTWVAPTNVTQEYLRQMPVGELFNSITHGVRNMPAYGSQIEPADRWAVILYLRALQRSRAGKVTDLSPAEQSGLN